MRLAEELLVRNATIAEFFLAYVRSNVSGIEANLHYMDYQRLKQAEHANRQAGSEVPWDEDAED